MLYGVDIAIRKTNNLRMAPPIADILHRGAVLTLVGVSVWGVATGYMVHKNTLKKGREVRSVHGKGVMVC
ncbi:hypothetical protein EWM64_g3304 [Hericium alpestre]|uniref:Uncharacterized protein n=1 Tax=Hericium alpestre TaxID=135208 RepID=A0A4Z0A2N5_9AGAM|nr:hypothetical protein EWM64_g3304 [Hericium alpestre]